MGVDQKHLQQKGMLRYAGIIAQLGIELASIAAQCASV